MDEHGEQILLDGLEPSCESCGKKGEDVDYCEDPFAAEIHDDHTQVWLCEKCWQNAADDI